MCPILLYLAAVVNTPGGSWACLPLMCLSPACAHSRPSSATLAAPSPQHHPSAQQGDSLARACAYTHHVYIRCCGLPSFYLCSTKRVAIPLFMGFLWIPQGFEPHFLTDFWPIFGRSRFSPAGLLACCCRLICAPARHCSRSSAPSAANIAFSLQGYSVLRQIRENFFPHKSFEVLLGTFAESWMGAPGI